MDPIPIGATAQLCRTLQEGDTSVCDTWATVAANPHHRGRNQLIHGGGRLDAQRLVATRRERGENFLRMLWVTRLNGDVESRAFGRHVQKQPAMTDFQDI